VYLHFPISARLLYHILGRNQVGILHKKSRIKLLKLYKKQNAARGVPSRAAQAHDGNVIS